MMAIDDLKVRIPHDLKEWLRQRADQNCRTMNSEILALLKATRGADEAQTSATKRARSSR